MFGSAPATFMMSRPFHHHGHSQDEYTVAAESLLQLLAWLANGVHTRIHSGRENSSRHKPLRRGSLQSYRALALANRYPLTTLTVRISGACR